MTKNFAERLNYFPLKGQRFENTQHSNRQGEIYEILRIYNGPCGIKVDVTYYDAVIETFDINQMRDDIPQPTNVSEDYVPLCCN